MGSDAARHREIWLPIHRWRWRGIRQWHRWRIGNFTISWYPYRDQRPFVTTGWRRWNGTEWRHTRKRRGPIFGRGPEANDGE